MAIFNYAIAGVLACACTATAASATTYLTVNPTDYNGFSSVDGGPFVGRTGAQKALGPVGQLVTNYYSVVNGVRGAPVLKTTTFMSAAEYDISALPQNINITSATLVASFTSSTSNQANMTLFGTEYVGDGSVTADDLTATGTRFTVAATYNNGFRVNVTAFVQSLVASGNDFAGFSFGQLLPDGCVAQPGLAKNCYSNILFHYGSDPSYSSALRIAYDVVNPPSGSGGTDASGITDVPAVPEPAAWGMMILGVGAVGFAMRRHKATTRLSYTV